MGNTNADVLRIQLANESSAAGTLRNNQWAYALDTRRTIVKQADGTLRYYWDSTRLADKTGSYGAGVIGFFGAQNILPLNLDLTPNGSVGDGSDVQSWLTGISRQANPYIHKDHTETSWTGGGGAQTLHTFTMDSDELHSNGESLKIRVVFSLAGSNSKSLAIGFGSDTIAVLTTTATGIVVFDIEVIRTGASAQLVNYWVLGVTDQNVDQVTGSQSTVGTIAITAQANVTSGATGDVKYESMTVQFCGTNFL